MKTRYLLLIVLLVSVLSVSAKSFFAANDLIGTWKYTVSDVPPEYQNGSMTFEEKEGKITGYMGDAANRTDMKELVVDQGKVTFKFDFEGGLLTINLTHDGEKLNGTVVHPEGNFPISAVKQEKK